MSAIGRKIEGRDLSSFFKKIGKTLAIFHIRKRAKIRNRYNQAPHLTHLLKQRKSPSVILVKLTSW